MKTDSVFKPYGKTRGKQRNTPCAYLGVAMLVVFSTSTLADRPAMENRLDDGITAIVDERESAENKMGEAQTTENQATEDQAAEQQTPAEPSAVEIMMQTQQTPQSQPSGDVIQLAPTEMQSGETIRIKLMDEPRRGMHMEKVQQTFGQPLATTAGVGTPPISSWTYGDRIVYFEYSTVLHVVAR